MPKTLCVSCNDSDLELTEKMFSSTNHTIPDWFKKIGNYSLLPPPLNCNPLFNLYDRTNITPKFPREYDTTLDISTKNLLPGVRDTWIFYWASRGRNYMKTSYPSAESAYGAFKNCGLAKLENSQTVSLRFKNPKPYQVDGTAYPPHIHFVALDAETQFWNPKLYTHLITPNIDLGLFRSLVASRKYLILNAIPESMGLPVIPNTHTLAFNTPIRQINNKIQTLADEAELDDENKITELPIIVYCKNPECDASAKLISSLRELSYINIITFKEGLEAFYDTTY